MQEIQGDTGPEISKPPCEVRTSMKRGFLNFGFPAGVEESVLHEPSGKSCEHWESLGRSANTTIRTGPKPATTLGTPPPPIPRAWLSGGGGGCDCQATGCAQDSSAPSTVLGWVGTPKAEQSLALWAFFARGIGHRARTRQWVYGSPLA